MTQTEFETLKTMKINYYSRLVKAIESLDILEAHRLYDYFASIPYEVELE